MVGGGDVCSEMMYLHYIGTPCVAYVASYLSCSCTSTCFLHTVVFNVFGFSYVHVCVRVCVCWYVLVYVCVCALLYNHHAVHIMYQ